ncbi:thiolase family protein [Rhodococcus artemisiae]|uniref:Thiolase family protein n=1 Tax=Rhodococcus artemisiae TaxID=714159 RepID=A0ABU7L7T8_9NOCA|nr:thiolase family protein [Rhodococcus artemisiae]MEE2056967.1 thiolase family protein [Rhodococcus artemisiae]
MNATAAAAAIVGAGESQFGRSVDRPITKLVLDACRGALDDAGLTASDIDGVVPAGTYPGPDEVSVALGIDRTYTAAPGIPAGAGPLAAVETARAAVESGRASTVLVYYGYAGSKPGGPYGFHAQDPVKASLEMPFGWYGQPVYFAAWAQRYCHTYAIEPDALGSIAVSNRVWATMTPNAQRPKPLTEDDYLASPMIASPLRSADCCLISDGAGALVVTTAERARDLTGAPVLVAGSSTVAVGPSMTSYFTQAEDMCSFGSSVSGPRAFADAGLTPADIDVAEIYDCFSISQAIQMEDLGLCGRGEAVEFHRDGHTRPGGSLPVNTHGGHLAYAYIPGIVHVIEAVRQVRGSRGQAQVPDASIALVAALAGGEHTTLILTKDG